MEYQEAITILKSMLDKHSFDEREKEAIMTAMGVLSWGALAKSKMKASRANREAKQNRSTEW